MIVGKDGTEDELQMATGTVFRSHSQYLITVYFSSRVYAFTTPSLENQTESSHTE